MSRATLSGQGSPGLLFSSEFSRFLRLLHTCPGHLFWPDPVCPFPLDWPQSLHRTQQHDSALTPAPKPNRHLRGTSSQHILGFTQDRFRQLTFLKHTHTHTQRPMSWLGSWRTQSPVHAQARLCTTHSHERGHAPCPAGHRLAAPPALWARQPRGPLHSSSIHRRQGAACPRRRAMALSCLGRRFVGQEETPLGSTGAFPV